MAVLAVGIGLVVAGTQGRVDHAHERAQDAVLVQAGHAVHQLQQRIARGLHLRVAVTLAGVDHGLEHLQGGVVASSQHIEVGLQLSLAGGDIVLALMAGSRIEAGFEQLDQQAGQQRVAREGAFHVGLRERHAGLQQVLAVATQHGDLAPMQAGSQHQAVEAVVLGIAVPDAGEGLAEGFIDAGGIDRAGGRLDLEVLHVHRRVVDRQAVRTLGDHAQAHVFHHRQRVRQRNVVQLAIQLQAQAIAAFARHGLQAQAQVVRAGQGIELADIVGGNGGAVVFDVAGRQCLADAGSDAQAFGFAVAGHQRFAQVVLPVAQHLGQLLLQFGGIDVQHFARLGAHDQVHLGQRRFAQHHRAVHVLAVQRVLQHRFDAQAHVGVEALTRQVDQRGDETTVLVAAQEQAAAHALLQAQHAHGSAEQFVLAGLEQFFARQGFQDVAQGLAAVAGRGQARLLHHVLVALAHQRDFPRATVVGAGGEQAEEALLADDLALGVEFQHADVVHVAGAVHARTGIGLGQDQRVLQPGRGVQALRGQGLDRTCGGLVLAAHQAQAGVVQRRQHLFLALLLDAVLAVAEEGEVVVGGPAQEFLCFLARRVVDRQLAVAQVVGQRQRLVLHRLPVAHDRTHFVQRLADGLLDGRHGFGRLAVDLQQHHRLGITLADLDQLAGLVAGEAQHRMAQHVDAHALFGQRHGDGVDQERHVVVDDLQHGVRRFPTVGLRGRIEHADVGLAGLAGTGEFQRLSRERDPLFSAVVRELVRLHALVEVSGEGHRFGLCGRGVTLAQCRVHRLQGETSGHCDLRLCWFGLVFHGLGCGFLRFHGRAMRLLSWENEIVALPHEKALLQDGITRFGFAAV